MKYIDVNSMDEVAEGCDIIHGSGRGGKSLSHDAEKQ